MLYDILLTTELGILLLEQIDKKKLLKKGKKVELLWCGTAQEQKFSASFSHPCSLLRSNRWQFIYILLCILLLSYIQPDDCCKRKRSKFFFIFFFPLPFFSYSTSKVEHRHRRYRERICKRRDGMTMIEWRTLLHTYDIIIECSEVSFACHRWTSLLIVSLAIICSLWCIKVKRDYRKK